MEKFKKTLWNLLKWSFYIGLGLFAFVWFFDNWNAKSDVEKSIFWVLCVVVGVGYYIMKELERMETRNLSRVQNLERLIREIPVHGFTPYEQMQIVQFVEANTPKTVFDDA